MINIDELIKNARSSGNKIELRAYQNIKAEFEKFKYAQKLPRKIDENLEIQLISNYNKKLEDAIEQFSEAHRDDLVAEYTSEQEVVKQFIPKAVNSQEIENFIENDEFFSKFYEQIHGGERGEMIYSELHIPKKEMGNCFKYLKSKFPSTNSKIISQVIQKYLV